MNVCWIQQPSTRLEALYSTISMNELQHMLLTWLPEPLESNSVGQILFNQSKNLTCCRALTGELWTLIFILWASILQKITLIWCITAFCSRSHAVYCSDAWASWNRCILGRSSIAYRLFQHSHCGVFFSLLLLASLAQQSQTFWKIIVTAISFIRFSFGTWAE